MMTNMDTIKINFQQIALYSYAILLFWTLINIFSSSEYTYITKLSNFIAIPGLFILFYSLLRLIKKRGQINYTKKQVIGIIGILCMLILAFWGSITQLLVNVRIFVVLGIIQLYLVYRDRIDIPVRANLIKIFYWLFFVFVLVNIVAYGRLDADFFFPGTMDKNYTGILVFLLFLLSFCVKKPMGVVLSSFYLIFMTESRSIYGMVILFFFVKVFRTQIWNVLCFLRLKKAFRQFSILFLGIICLSFFWIQFVSVNPLSDYRQGINDGSNKMRFAANIYAVQQIEQRPQSLYYGLGDNIKTVFGIDSEDFSEHTQFMGVRLVQPHNSFLNMMLKIGVIEAVIYFLFLAYILDRIKSKQNIEYYLPYVINACFMHSLLDGPYLVIWTFILMITQEQVEGVKYEASK